MNKKILIISITAAAILVVGIIIGIISLYSNGSGKNSQKSAGSYPLLQAVPSDAALVMHFKSLDKALDIMADSTMAFKGIGGAGKENFDKFISILARNRKIAGSLKSHSAAIAMLSSGNLVPILIIDGGKSQSDSLSHASSLLALADSVKLYAAETGINKKYVLVSPSETVLSSSERHLSNGLSVLDSEGMKETAAITSGDNVIFINCSYSGKILTSHFPSKYNKHSELFKKLGKWASLSITDYSEKHTSLEGTVGGKLLGSSFITMANSAGGSDVKVQDVLPADTYAFISVPVADAKEFFSARDKFLDANGKLEKHKSENQAFKSTLGSSAEDWMKRSGIREAAIAWFHNGKQLEEILLMRTDAKKETSEIKDNDSQGLAKCLFGDIFSLADESCSAMYKGWQIIGSRAALEVYLSEGFLNNTVKQQLADCNLSGRIPSKNANFVLYWSATTNPSLLDDIFKTEAASAFKDVIKGVGFTPAVLSITNGTNIRLDVDRMNITKSKAPVVERDNTVIVPEGPFKVKNSGTGQTNLFYQNDNLYLCLKEEGGKGIWGVPFKEKICGSVESIEWYGNGKIQFLFGAGSKLYLIDRLGRFVNPFPVDLGKEILIGPAAYDFTGAHGYTAMVLHKDNTIEMYNLHGQKPENWNGITSEETIKALPELLTSGKNKYWAVRTSIRTLIFGFNGGEPLTKNDGDKMIRPDSKITLNDNGTVTATCYDGKERNIKLQNKD